MKKISDPREVDTDIWIYFCSIYIIYYSFKFLCYNFNICMLSFIFTTLINMLHKITLCFNMKTCHIQLVFEPRFGSTCISSWDFQRKPCRLGLPHYWILMTIRATRRRPPHWLGLASPSPSKNLVGNCKNTPTNRSTMTASILFSTDQTFWELTETETQNTNI